MKLIQMDLVEFEEGLDGEFSPEEVLKLYEDYKRDLAEQRDILQTDAQLGAEYCERGL
jgi:hypothetical protein